MFIEGGPYIQTFLGECFGVGLGRRSPNDTHISFTLLIGGGGGGGWFVTDQPGGSSHWIPELIKQLQLAQNWLEKNAVPDGKYGYKLSE